MERRTLVDGGTKKPACVVLGAGGHARVLVTILTQSVKPASVAILDRTATTMGEAIGDWKVSGSFRELAALKDLGVTDAYLAVGDNAEREELAHLCLEYGFRLPVLKHPSAIVEPHAYVGRGTLLCAQAVIGAAANIGVGCIVNTAATVDHETNVGDFAHLAPGVHVAGRCTIGPRSFLGIGSSVIDRRRIGARTVVGAGSVVVSDLEDEVVAYGVPATVRRMF